MCNVSLNNLLIEKWTNELVCHLEKNYYVMCHDLRQCK
jgi:hypothetical protein